VLRMIMTILVLLAISSCATVFRGQFENVLLVNPPEDLIIETPDGIRIPITVTKVKGQETDRTNPATLQPLREMENRYWIELRSSEEQILHLKYDGQTRKIALRGNIYWGFVFFDTVTGVLPAFFDAYTGAWYYYEDIRFDEQ
jgi:hypothetical protein